ncbi:MAG: class I SAM-dependent methyltransferase, partial [Alkalinema sp. RL_2_19]|nr:class I SAM-dependent methyltransferase [Alkalinema sp. RL_2_19]
DVSQAKRFIYQIRNQDPALGQSRPNLTPLPAANPAADAQLDDFYSAFEDEFRGSRAAINQRLQKYMPLIADANLSRHAKILDVGCGRGEWLEILRDAGYDRSDSTSTMRCSSNAAPRG